MISRFLESNFLKSFSKGVFYLPKVDKNGVIPLSPLAIKSLVITSNEYGCEIGEVLYHQLKLTYQKPKTYRYYTSNLIEHKKTYGIATFHRLDVHFDTRSERRLKTHFHWIAEAILFLYTEYIVKIKK